jgi:hypothetical protein
VRFWFIPTVPHPEFWIHPGRGMTTSHQHLCLFSGEIHPRTPSKGLSPVSYFKTSYKMICLVSRRQLARDSSSVDSHVDSGTASRSCLIRATPRNNSRISSHHPRISTQCLTRPIPVTPHPTSSSLSRWPSTAVLISAQSPLSTT